MPLKVLFLSSDTGGGHRASSESLAAQFQLLYPGTTYDLLDVQAKDGVPPYNKLVESYKHLSAHPQQWNFVFNFSNSKAFEFFFDVSQKAMCEKAMRKTIMEYDPDVVVSVHPMMTNVPALCCKKISEETGRYLPIFTVVTDLSSAHCLWFYNGVDKVFVASDQCRHLAKVRGKVPDAKIVQIGLPIRHSFAVQAEALGDRMSDSGVEYQKKVRAELGLSVVDKKTVLVMGGGEGVGSLSNIVNALYMEFVEQGIDALILVVCGRNEKLKKDLEVRDWNAVVMQYHKVKERKVARSLQDFSITSCVSGLSTGTVISAAPSSGCMEGSVTQQIRKMFSSSRLNKENAMSSPELMTPDEAASDNASAMNFEDVPDINRLPTTSESNEDQQDEKREEQEQQPQSKEDDENCSEPRNLHEASEEIYAKANKKTSTIKTKKGEVTVVGLGFVTKMAEYMVAADVLVSKAGPGTIAEAASLSLPVMLTSFLPGQEEGNVDFVIKGGFGAFVSDRDPAGIAEEVGQWLTDGAMAAQLSRKAKENGAPNAARDIVAHIGKLSLKWKKINDDRQKLDMEAEKLKLGIPSNDDDESGILSYDDEEKVEVDNDGEVTTVLSS